MKDVEQALLDFIRIFDAQKIPYAVMGGLAVRAYGVPRPTYDVDVTISVDTDRLPALYQEVKAAGYTVPEAYLSGWVDRIAEMPLVKFRIYRPDRSVDVDVFLAETAFQREIMSRRKESELDVGAAWLVTPEDLILLKLIAGRPRDLGDVQDVLFMQGELDEPYMHRWAEELGVAAALDHALANRPGDERP